MNDDFHSANFDANIFETIHQLIIQYECYNEAYPIFAKHQFYETFI